jgi:hypothetical protein
VQGRERQSAEARRPEDYPVDNGLISTIRAALPKPFAAMVDCGSVLGMRQREVLGLASGDVAAP